MSDLFKKLNVLVKAKLNDALPGIEIKSPLQKRNINKQVDALRKQVNDAVEYEDTLQQRVTELQNEVDRLDREADKAVERGDDDTAKHIIGQLERAKQRLNMAQSDLNAHQLVAEDFIRKVNLLDATAADIQHEEATSAPAPTEEDSPASILTKSPEEIMQSAQDKISGLGELLKTKKDQLMPSPTDTHEEKMQQVEEEIKKAKVEDDLAARRRRLSK